MKDIFDAAVTEEQIRRIRMLSPETRPLWGKMNAAQMLAHLCVSYEMVYEDRHRRPGRLMRLLLRAFVKNAVVGDKPYRRNTPTAPAFRVTDARDFERERDRLIGFLRRTQELGPAYFDGRESHSFGPLTLTEWNNLFYKHLDHHLRQFGV
jgi:hypothetical protein